MKYMQIESNQLTSINDEMSKIPKQHDRFDLHSVLLVESNTCTIIKWSELRLYSRAVESISW